jgi:hypothetical protein
MDAEPQRTDVDYHGPERDPEEVVRAALADSQLG